MITTVNCLNSSFNQLHKGFITIQLVQALLFANGRQKQAKNGPAQISRYRRLRDNYKQHPVLSSHIATALHSVPFIANNSYYYREGLSQNSLKSLVFKPYKHQEMFNIPKTSGFSLSSCILLATFLHKQTKKLGENQWFSSPTFSL